MNIYLDIQVGYETINNSEDKILKQDMPPALNRVEEASILLLEASQMLRQDPYSAPARKKLIEGSRGKDVTIAWLDDRKLRVGDKGWSRRAMSAFGVPFITFI